MFDNYFLGCQRVCWVDSYADAVHALHLHNASGASLYGDYSVMLLQVFAMDPDLLRPELWPLMFALRWRSCHSSASTQRLCCLLFVEAVRSCSVDSFVAMTLSLEFAFEFFFEKSGSSQENSASLIVACLLYFDKIDICLCLE